MAFTKPSLIRGCMSTTGRMTSSTQFPYCTEEIFSKPQDPWPSAPRSPNTGRHFPVVFGLWRWQGLPPAYVAPDVSCGKANAIHRAFGENNHQPFVVILGTRDGLLLGLPCVNICKPNNPPINTIGWMLTSFFLVKNWG